MIAVVSMHLNFLLTVLRPLHLSATSATWAVTTCVKVSAKEALNLSAVQDDKQNWIKRNSRKLRS